MLEVGIVGAGIGGLCAGMMLKSIGCNVTIFEKLPFNASSGVGIQVSANGIRALRAYGLEDKIVELGDFPDHIDCVNGRTGENLAKIPLGRTAQNLYGAGFYQFHRGDFVSLLAKENLKLGTTISYETPVLDLEQNPNGVTISTSRGCSQFDLVVAADGINSVVRNRVFGGQAPIFMNQVAYRTLISSDDLPAVFSSYKTRLFLGAGKHVVSYPIRKRSMVNFVFCTDLQSYCQESWDNDVALSEIKDNFSDFATLRDVFNSILVAKKWGLFTHPLLKTWHKKRIVLLGDSCHPILPYLAQGATQAIEDAHELCNRVKEILDTQNLELALRRYKQNRVSRVARVSRASQMNAKLFHIRNPVLAFGFHFILKMVGLVYPKFLLKRFSWIYSGGPA